LGCCSITGALFTLLLHHFLCIFSTYLCYTYPHKYTAGMVEVNVGKLKELRDRRVLTLHELEERSGVAYNTIWRLENGKTGAQPRTIRKLAKALGVEAEELVRVRGSDG
jgi:DNA-binding XRE family transcriptional regulator